MPRRSFSDDTVMTVYVRQGHYSTQAKQLLFRPGGLLFRPNILANSPGWITIPLQ